MTSADHAVDLDALLAPIPGANPAGADIRYEPVYDKIKAARRAAGDKQQGRSAFSDADDKLSLEERASVARADWLAVQSLVTDALTTRSKDLQLAVWLLEVQARVNGFPGTAGGLQVLRQLIELYWDSLYPPVENEAEEEDPLGLRVSVMNWIDDEEKFPHLLKSVPLTDRPTSYSLLHYEATRETGKKKEALIASGWPELEQFDKAMADSSRERLETQAQQIAVCKEQLGLLEQVANVRFVSRRASSGGAERVETLLGFGRISEVLESCRWLVDRALRAKGPPVASASSPGGTQPSPGDAQPSLSPPGGDGNWDRALQLAMQGQLEGLRLAQNHIDAAPSGRERFLRQLQLSELCIQVGMHAFAYPILDELGKTIDERHLDAWEDREVIRRAWSGLAAVCRPLARLRPETVAREVEAQDRLKALTNT
jgi:type VI secretion system protein ImpA